MPHSNLGKSQRQESAPEAHTTKTAGPEEPTGVIILPVTAARSRSDGALRRVAAGLRDRGFATFLAELLSAAEAEHGYHHFDFEMLADRISGVTAELRRQAPFAELPIGYFGTSTDATAMAIAAARPDCSAGALVMFGAHPELASVELRQIRAPTLLIVEENQPALDLNRCALARLRCKCELTSLPSSRLGLESTETVSRTIRLAADWFEKHLHGG